MLLLALLLGCSSTEHSDPDGSPMRVEVATGHYFAVVPDTLAPAPAAIIYLHGHGGDAEAISGLASWQGQLAASGAIGLFAQGAAAGNWKVGHHVPEIERDDVAFLEAVAADAQARWGPSAIWLAGTSEGASMLYEVSCSGTATFDGYAPMAGSFWLPRDGDCEAVDAPVWHRHGQADDTWPYEGEDTSWSGRKAGVEEGLSLLAEARGCAQPRFASDDDCTWVEDCGADLRVCMHSGGHVAPEGWIEALVGAVEGL
jgi:polyhydroxybutyrate depolymerase